MQSLNKNGVSITQTLGEEKFVKCRLSAFKGQTFYQYDYRHTDGELFSTVAKTLGICPVLQHLQLLLPPCHPFRRYSSVPASVCRQ